MIKKSVMLLGKSNNKVRYFQRLNILNVSLNSKSDAKGLLNSYAPLLSTNSTGLFERQFWKQVLDNTKAQKETLEIFREVGKSKKKPFSASFQRETNSHKGEVLETTTEFLSINIFERSDNKDGREIQQAKPPINQMVRLQKQHFCQTSSTKKIRTRSSFSKRNVPGGTKTKCSFRRRDFPFRAILGKAHKRSGNFSEVFMGREPLRVPVSVFWSRTTHSSFYQKSQYPFCAV